MKTLIIALSIAGTVSVGTSLQTLVEPILPTALRGSTCAAVCDCRYGPCDYNQESSAKTCTINGRSTDCCSYCSQ